MNIQNHLLKEFSSVKELEETIASILIEEFQKPGLVILPVGSTFESRIYKLVNEFFSSSESLSIDLKTGDDTYIKQDRKTHPDLRLTHLDELIDAPNSFADDLKNALPEVMKQVGENFYAINTQELADFDRFWKLRGGPKTIFLGLGADPATAHIAFIGEEYVNNSTAVIELSPLAAKKHDTYQAATIGTDIFESANLEKIIVVAYGKEKAESLKAAFENPDTGLGYLIENHSEKLNIYLDKDMLIY